ncbi:MCE family protein [Mycolicibacter longobardus]|uniref:Mammalian cell entry protein n=1 Tax=Mycolicibacter longobardus TaxID=1108812 RepID=A0A1X1YAP7_9MYCO|nr:MCE family protein [Mycolicibacter longobardus]ORW08101.1 mammalian cell entry protein [Mycolicibacter longobardus]
MRSRSAGIGFALFLVVAAVATTLVYGTLSRDTTGRTDEYSAMFTDATGLREGDDVRTAGVRVGRVESVSLAGSLAKVTFRIHSDQVIYGNTVASVRYQNIVGQRYLGLSRGRIGDPARRLSPGAELPVDHTEPSFDVGALLNGFEPLFTLLDPAEADKLSKALLDAFQGDSAAIAHFVSQSTELTAAFAGRDQMLGDLIDGLNSVATDLARQDDNLNSVIDNARRVVTELNQRRDTVVSSVGALRHVSERLAAIGDNTYPQFSEMVHREPGFAAHMVENHDQIAFLGSNLPLLLKGLARVSQDGSYGNAYACSLNLMGFFPGLNDLVPAIVRRASPGDDVKNSQKCRPAE